jgi:alpha-tubulin suppressor-like RCC1 family protein
MSVVQSRTRVALVFLVALALVALLLLPALAAAVPQKAAASDAESYVVKSDGTLWAWGGNAFGGLGIGSLLPQGLPVQVGTDTDWATVSYSDSYGVVGLKQDGTVWHWGELGIPFVMTPVQFTGGTWVGTWNVVAAGTGHGLLLKSGELWAWGSNTRGQLGKGIADGGSATPIHIGSATWTSIAAGMYHSLAIKADGTLWAWGGNDQGQLGLGDTADRPAPTQVGSATDWKAVYAGRLGSYALKTSGKLYAWGWNEYGQLGLGSTGGVHDAPAAVTLPGTITGTGWTRVAPGPLDCVAIRDDGSLWSMGYNADGQLGLPADYVYHSTPTRVGTATSWADVACGAYHTIAVTNDDRFAACGSNQYGQIGLGFPLYRCSPEKVGTAAGWAQVDASLTHAAGIRSDGTLWTWGYNIDGLGQDAVFGNLNAPAQVGVDTDWKAVSCGAYTDGNFTLAIKTGGTLWSWGDNAVGQLGLGDKTSRPVPTQVGTGTDWKAVAASDGVGDRGRVIYGDPFTHDDHALAIKGDGTLWSWGANDYGQLGLGDTVRRLSPVQVGTDADWKAVAAGDDYSAAVKTDGSLWVWGRNAFGQLGLGDMTERNAPVRVLTGSGVETFSAFACGSGRDSSHMLAVKTDGTLWGWGNNVIGELGKGLAGMGMYMSPTQIGSGAGWMSVACGGSYGDDFSLATTTSDELWTWGGDYRGQLGNGDYVSLYAPQKMAGSAVWSGFAAGSNSFGIQSDGTLWAWGDNAYGQLGLGDASAYSSTAVYPLADIVDSTPPVVEGSVGTGVARAAGSARGTGGWSRTPRTIRVTATDAVAGVARAQISLTGGISYVSRTSTTIRNGNVKVWVRAFDRKGNLSLPKHVGDWKIDTTKPKPAALAARVKRGSTAKLKYRIADYSPCAVKIAVKNARGVTVKTLAIRGARPMSWLTASFRCTLARGTYRWYVTATDSVGYKQVKAAVGKLIVK